jgi:transposase
MEIFLSAGFDIDLIGHKKPKHSLKHWRESFAALGEDGLLEERRVRAVKAESQQACCLLRKNSNVLKHELSC